MRRVDTRGDVVYRDVTTALTMPSKHLLEGRFVIVKSNDTNLFLRCDLPVSASTENESRDDRKDILDFSDYDDDASRRRLRRERGNSNNNSGGQFTCKMVSKGEAREDWRCVFQMVSVREDSDYRGSESFPLVSFRLRSLVTGQFLFPLHKVDDEPVVFLSATQSFVSFGGENYDNSDSGNNETGGSDGGGGGHSLVRADPLRFFANPFSIRAGDGEWETSRTFLALRHKTLVNYWPFQVGCCLRSASTTNASSRSVSEGTGELCVNVTESPIAWQLAPSRIKTSFSIETIRAAPANACIVHRPSHTSRHHSPPPPFSRSPVRYRGSGAAAPTDAETIHEEDGKARGIQKAAVVGAAIAVGVMASASAMHNRHEAKVACDSCDSSYSPPPRPSSLSPSSTRPVNVSVARVTKQQQSGKEEKEEKEDMAMTIHDNSGRETIIEAESACKFFQKRKGQWELRLSLWECVGMGVVVIWLFMLLRHCSAYDKDDDDEDNRDDYDRKYKGRWKPSVRLSPTPRSKNRDVKKEEEGKNRSVRLHPKGAVATKRVYRYNFPELAPAAAAAAAVRSETSPSPSPSISNRSEFSRRIA